jgi:hypothetical protein
MRLANSSALIFGKDSHLRAATSRDRPSAQESASPKLNDFPKSAEAEARGREGMRLPKGSVPRGFGRAYYHPMRYVTTDFEVGSLHFPLQLAFFGLRLRCAFVCNLLILFGSSGRIRTYNPSLNSRKNQAAFEDGEPSQMCPLNPHGCLSVYEGNR